jgi:hypothetical protein
MSSHPNGPALAQLQISAFATDAANLRLAPHRRGFSPLLFLPQAPSLTACCHGGEPAKRRFGRRPHIRGGQQKRQAGVCSKLRGLKDEIEIAHERVVKPVQACCGEAHVVL